MKDTGNKFYDNLPKNQKSELDILFRSEVFWNQSREDFERKQEYNKKFDEKYNTHNIVTKPFKSPSSSSHFKEHYAYEIKINDVKKEFKNKLKIFIDLQKNTSQIDLSYIYIPININWYKYLSTDKNINFNNTTFEDEANFKNMTFDGDINFKVATFKDKANFWKTSFNGNTTFKYVTFQNDAIFQLTTFNSIDLSYSKAVSYIDFFKATFQTINLENSHFINAKFLNLQNKQGENLYKDNFMNKESARIIKDHFEKQNNITEANKYFALEQNKYLEELKKSIHENNYKNFLVVWLNKYVSYFGTDWMRPLLSIFIFGYIASLGYGFIQEGCESINFTKSKLFLFSAFLYSLLVYYFYHKKLWVALVASILAFFSLLMGDIHLREISNDISKLINPLNIFKPKVNYFENIAIYGMLVKLGMSVLIYQFIMAFRQNTRRK